MQSIGALCEISTSNNFFYIFLPSITLKPEHTYANFVSSVRASTGGAVKRIHGEVVLPLRTPIWPFQPPHGPPRAILGHGGALLHVIVAIQTQPTNLVVPSLSRAAVKEPPFLIEPLVAIL